MSSMEEVLMCVFPNGGKYLFTVLVLSPTAGHVDQNGSVSVEKSTWNLMNQLSHKGGL